jgi:predicted metal-dependent phosphoesterase TrpH
LLTIDLHCHSDRSDGALAPQDLIARAAMRGVRALALTDHDTIAGIAQARLAAREHGIELIPGVEISVTWGSKTLHVLGLRIDPAAPALLEGLATVRATRIRRAETIALRLQREGIRDAFAAVLAAAAAGETVSRTHFARHLVALGVVRDVHAAFRRFLAEGKPGHVRARWAGLDDAIRWIRAAGGVAVLAHPARYGLKPGRLFELCGEFRSLGGEAIEVVSASHTPEDVARLAVLAQASDLRASAGSDFHSAAESWLDLGDIAPLPSHCRPVWQDWPECRSFLLH